MILVGQYDSPFVRRVGVALTLYRLPFEHRPWSVFGDAEKVGALNPLVRVPTLVLDGGEALFDSAAILDHLDGLAPPGEALIASAGAARREAMRVAAVACGLADMAVSLFYAQRLTQGPSDGFAARRRSQIAGALRWLEHDRAARSGRFWSGERIGHCDIAVACMLRHLTESQPGLVAMDDHPALAAHAARCEALPAFRTIAQPFVAPA